MRVAPAHTTPQRGLESMPAHPSNAQVHQPGASWGNDSTPTVSGDSGRTPPRRHVLRPLSPTAGDSPQKPHRRDEEPHEEDHARVHCSLTLCRDGRLQCDLLQRLDGLQVRGDGTPVRPHARPPGHHHHGHHKHQDAACSSSAQPQHHLGQPQGPEDVPFASAQCGAALPTSCGASGGGAGGNPTPASSTGRQGAAGLLGGQRCDPVFGLVLANRMMLSPSACGASTAVLPRSQGAGAEGCAAGASVLGGQQGPGEEDEEEEEQGGAARGQRQLLRGLGTAAGAAPISADGRGAAGPFTAPARQGVCLCGGRCAFPRARLGGGPSQHQSACVVRCATCGLRRAASIKTFLRSPARPTHAAPPAARPAPAPAPLPPHPPHLAAIATPTQPTSLGGAHDAGTSHLTSIGLPLTAGTHLTPASPPQPPPHPAHLAAQAPCSSQAFPPPPPFPPPDSPACSSGLCERVGAGGAPDRHASAAAHQQFPGGPSAADALQPFGGEMYGTDMLLER